ncbi:AzlC family ABC transporter permease [Anaeromyxobacter dehalogenans]|uniref:AzlC-like protein n=1 Tax=Anaeromyxobacter dehalogenans (strain 2CP-C) TaxID=290397 RepID=Q2ILU0_ANADE|nr:AzlC family ABC transporter permease [Anaeromyxobacter dehalogenans]ABC82621.1 AzlC-like protein [Anaeromyxobacter dehalogenans 2CP-C]
MTSPAIAAPARAHPGRSAAQEFWSGVRDLAPLLLGVVPYGFVYGVLARASGLDAATAMAASAILFAGAAQFLLAQLVAAGALGVVMVAAVALVNLRHALYSASVAPHLAHLPLRWKLALSYLLTDESYAVAMRRLGDGDRSPARHWHLLGAGVALWSGWQLATAAGVWLGARVPARLPLDVALPLTFIAIAVPMIRSRALLAAAVAAGIVALAAAGWPWQLGLLAASVAGILAGALVAPRRAR